MLTINIHILYRNKSNSVTNKQISIFWNRAKPAKAYQRIELISFCKNSRLYDLSTAELTISGNNCYCLFYTLPTE